MVTLCVGFLLDTVVCCHLGNSGQACTCPHQEDKAHLLGCGARSSPQGMCSWHPSKSVNKSTAMVNLVGHCRLSYF
jgi:hypothetical protein